MIHKQIGGKKNQRKVENSLDYILRTRQNDKDEDRNFVQVMTATTRADIENFNNYIKPKIFLTHTLRVFFHLKKTTQTKT